MLNINQNFDLKAPVFNFDRDYFNSVEELNAYDTSNVPNHFVTNVAGMLYLFTDGKWLPMIGTEYDTDTLHYVNLGCTLAYLEIDTQNNVQSSLLLYSTSGHASLSPTSLNITNVDPIGGVSIEADYNGTSAGITVSGDSTSNTIVTNSLIICGDDSFKVDIYGDEGRMEINDAQGRRTNYSASGFSGQTKDNTTSYSLNLPSKNTDTLSLSLKSNLGDFIFDAGNGLNINYSNGYFIYTDAGDGSINLGKTSEKFNYSNTICPESISIRNFDGGPSFVISCLDSTEGATITGVKSLTAFANPSATKVWATDGSTVDLTTYTNYFNGTTTADKLKSKAVEVTDATNLVIVSPTGITATNGSATKVFATDGSIADLSTKANTSDLATKANASDVLLKKSTSGGYYIEENSNALGLKAFAANNECAAIGTYAHAAGNNTKASGQLSHAEGENTLASGYCAHTEGYGTKATGSFSLAQGCYNVDNKFAIHSIGIGKNSENRKNSEWVLFSQDDPKNGYKYLIGVGGYDGISTDNTTYKSVQEVIADLTARIEQLEKLTANCVSISNVDEQTN